MAIDVSTLVNAVNQTRTGREPSRVKNHGGFAMGGVQSSGRTTGGFRQPNELPAGNKKPGGFGDLSSSHYGQMRSLARMNPGLSFINEYGQRESGWEYQQPPLVRVTNYDRVLDMVKNAAGYERIEVVAPRGTVEHRRQLGEQMGNPAGIRVRRKTVRQILTGR